MAIQTSYSERISAARVGQIANTEDCVLISRNVETAAGIAFGLPVMQGAAEDGVVILAGGATNIVGITVRERSVNPDFPSGFQQYESARLMRRGVLWVTVTDAGGVAQGDPVWVTEATGAFSNADVGTGGGQRINGAIWDSNGVNGGLARIRFDLDNGLTAGA